MTGIPKDYALHRDETDDPEFLELMTGKINTVVHRFRPKQLHVVAVDNWFGERWLGFTGKMMGAFGVSRRGNLTLPPFVPSRVRSETDLERENGVYRRRSEAPSLHREQPSSDNFRRRISRLGASVALVWYSGASSKTRRAAAMVYLNLDEEQLAWYGSYVYDRVWRLGTQHGDHQLIQKAIA